MERKKRSIIWTISISEISLVVKDSYSYSEVLRKLGFTAVTGTLQRVLKSRIQSENISTAHFSVNGRRWERKSTKPSLDKILVKNSSYDRKDLKKRVIADGVVKNECAECGQLLMWNNKPLVLVLDHINGVNNDNRKENLRLLCPNCNSQMSTFCGRNTKMRW